MYDIHMKRRFLVLTSIPVDQFCCIGYIGRRCSFVDSLYIVLCRRAGALSVCLPVLHVNGSNSSCHWRATYRELRRRWQRAVVQLLSRRAVIGQWKLSNLHGPPCTAHLALPCDAKKHKLSSNRRKTSVQTIVIYSKYVASICQVS